MISKATKIDLFQAEMFGKIQNKRVCCDKNTNIQEMWTVVYRMVGKIIEIEMSCVTLSY